MRFGPARAAAAGLGIGAVPLAALAALVVAGALQAGPAILAAGAIVGLYALLAVVWVADLARLAPLLLADEAAAGPRLWPQRRVSTEILRQTTATRAERTHAEQQAQAALRIVDILPDPLVVLAADRSVLRANRAAQAALGADLSAVLRHPSLRGAIDRVRPQRDAAEPGHTMETVALLLPAPVPRDLQATVIDLGDGAGDGGRYALVLADRTEARAVERMRADFVANASHELRTPLASLIGFIDTLRGPAADDFPAQQRFLGIMAEQAARMSRLIDDLLSLSRIELTEHLAPSDRVDVAELIARSLSFFEPRRAAAGVTIVQDIATGIPPVPADADQLEQVLSNLLDNALKYGRPGGTIHVSLRLAGAGRWPPRPALVMAVRDEGQGIARQHLPRLTERFYRVDRGRSRAAGGTGLGLAIVKHIVSRHRGQLHVDSEEGVGTTFSIWLPLAG